MRDNDAPYRLPSNPGQHSYSAVVAAQDESTVSRSPSPHVAAERASKKGLSTTVKRISSSNLHQSRGTPSVWRRGWKVPAGIIGFYLLAVICAVAHLLFFIQLNGRLINTESEQLPFDTTSVPQAYATTASLALVTIFRATAVASTGLAFTQYLWKQLRHEVLEVGHIEELFQIRANAFRLLNPSLIQIAPVLISIAVISWLLPVAMIYPPGALVVGIEYHQVPIRINTSVFPADNVAYPWTNGTQRGYHEPGLADVYIDGSDVECNAPSKSFCTYILTLTGSPLTPLRFLAKSVLTSSRITELDNPKQQNASYTLKFQGPRVKCNDTRQHVVKSFANMNNTDYAWTSKNLTVRDPRTYSINLIKTDWTYAMKQNKGSFNIPDTAPTETMFCAPCPRRNDTWWSKFKEDESKPLQLAKPYQLIHSSTVRRCVSATAEYSVDISFISGTQRVSYAIKNEQAMTYQIAFSPQQRTLPPPMRTVQEYYNILALVDALGENFDIDGRWENDVQFDESKIGETQTLRFDNGTEYQGCYALRGRFRQMTTTGGTVLSLSTLNTNRTKEIELRDSKIGNLNVTEAMLNEALANITISALSLNTWYEMVNGSATRIFNVYRFENRLSFYLPYGLSLLFILPILFLGIFALKHNGVTAIDGGFVQILMTTTGRTELEAAAVEGCIGGEESIPTALKKLKIRFGELCTDEPQHGPSFQFSDDDNHIPEDITLSASDAHYIETIRSDSERDNSNVFQQEQTTERASLTTGTQTPHLVGNVFRRAGFGLTSETTPLERGALYGRSSASGEKLP